MLELLEKEKDSEKYVINENVKEIRFENVSYKYSDEMKFEISDVSFVLNAGEKVAFVGASGSGKTTIAKLLMHQCRAASGKIFINGIEIEQLDTHALHRKIGFVMQDSKLLNMTIRENILLGNPSAGNEEVIEACRQAGILKEIESLENGLETMVGENGIKFSGGQRQRIILARVFLQNPDIYVFDEATSALDGISENHINHAIETMKNKIVVIIAHRLSAIQLCERIYVVKEGGVRAAVRAKMEAIGGQHVYSK